jgi:cytochrome c2
MRNPIERLVAYAARAAVIVAALSPGVASAASGEEIFQARCSACHTVGGGRRVGPDLKGVSERHTPDWIVKFVQSSQTVIKSGDPEATKLFDAYKVQMPDQPLTAAEVASIVEYTKSAGGGATSSAAPAAPEFPKVTAEELALGQKLFAGTVRFANGGPSCNSCHDVTNDAIISGGVLAPQLTTVFSKLGGGGVRAILGSPPFPVMQKAYDGRPILPAEANALVGFLAKANEGQKDHMPRDTGIKLFGGGVGGALFLMTCYSIVWRRRRRASVNQDIYDRQVKSE